MITSALLFGCNESVKETETVTIAKNSDWATSHLKGMVQTLEETVYTPDSTGAIGEMDSCCIEVKVFNDKGYVIEISEKDNMGTLTSETLFERIEGARFKSATTTKNGIQVWHRATTHDADGKILYVTDSDSTGQVTRFYSDITENEIDQPLSGKTYLSDSTFLGTWSFKYIDGMRTGNSWIDSTGTELSNRTGELNEKGLLAKMTRVQSVEDSTLTTVETYTYESFDEAGNWTQGTKYNEEGKAVEVKKRTYTYFKED